MRGVVCLYFLIITIHVNAWGRDGHSIIASIAQDLLTDNTRTSVLKLLGDEGNMSAVANWADQMTHTQEFKWTAPLHFTNVQDDSVECKHKKQCTYVITRDCVDTHGNKYFCNAGAINNFSTILQNNVHHGISNNATVQALKFVIHFIGDIHQPLHCGVASDRGGVKINVDFPVNRQGEHWNLHNVWDFGLIVNYEGVEGNQEALTNTLEQQLQTTWRKNISAWQKIADPNVWVQESLDRSTEFAYRFSNGTLIPDDTHDEIILGSGVNAYMNKGAIIQQQLAKAAVRLAATLENVFASL